MMDAGFLAELRTWAGNAEGVLLARWVNSGERDATAIVTARLFGELAAKMEARLAAERARLAAAVASAEEAVTAANGRAAWAERAIEAAVAQHLGATIRANHHRRLEAAERDAGDATRALDAARQALANFDAVTKGGE